MNQCHEPLGSWCAPESWTWGVEIVAFLSRFSKNVVVSTSILQEKANKTESQFVRVVWLLGSLLEVPLSERLSDKTPDTTPDKMPGRIVEFKNI